MSVQNGNLRFSSLGLFGAILLVISSLPAHAAMDVLFDYSEPATRHGSGSTMHYYYDGGSTGPSVSVSGWHSSDNTSTFRNKTNRWDTSNNGIGIDHKESGDQEMIDNVGRMELIVLEFDELVSVDQVNLGAVGGDFDFTLLAHTGPTGPTLVDREFGYNPNNSSKRMLNQGWELIGSYGENTMSTSVNSNKVYSSFWAIGAYTSVIHDSALSFGSLNQGDDYFSLMSLAGERIAQATVNAPGSWLMLALGLALLVGFRRQHKA